MTDGAAAGVRRPKHRPLEGARVVLGVCGGIAAYKAAEVARLLVKAGARVQVVMTHAAQEFVRPLTFQTLTGQPVATELFDLTQESEIGHIQLATDADLIVVAPATADVIARLAQGRADDMITTAALVTRAPILLAPAMNVNMWDHPFVKENVERLRGLGRVHFVGPDAGWLACRMVGPGRLAEPGDILEAAGRVLTERDLGAQTVLVTAGPTREVVDPVRYLSNRSTGKMGFALARAAAARGARVTLVSGPTSLDAPMGVDVVRVTSAADMHREVTSRAGGVDVVIMAAAVADFRPSKVEGQKLKKDSVGPVMALDFERTTDILGELGSAGFAQRRPFLVGFAAETDAVVEHTRAKLVKKGCDLVVGNDVSRQDAGFETDENEVVIVGPRDAEVRVPHGSKDQVAHAIWDRIVQVRSNR